MRKRLLLISGIIIVLCAVGVAIYIAMMLINRGDSGKSGGASDQARVTPVTVCTNDVIAKASSAIGANNLSELSAVANEVTAIGKYKNDANCEYIMVRYYLASGQAEKAGDAIDQLQRVLSAGGAYSTEFNPPAVNIADLRGSLATLKAQQKAGTQQISGDELNKVDEQK
jgi:hypothetical protein